MRDEAFAIRCEIGLKWRDYGRQHVANSFNPPFRFSHLINTQLSTINFSLLPELNLCYFPRLHSSPHEIA